ncbi:VOC family protein [Sphingobacterium bambusae]|uniref:VOC family protein n=1 Tax=Sphingobacterium bambusae TaxID=662858 RepID=A0ABW6BBI6_9SPHI|nr:VOC family protein [Sphingobacterium bambusae]WPL49127.1 VOC family protein [Sphingobacterium bambusae]
MNLAKNIIGFHHVSIKANDLDTTINFYQNLGFSTVHGWSLPEINMQKCVMMYNRSINYYLEICDKGAQMPTQGRARKDGDEYIENALLHMCFTVKNAAAARTEALKYGAKELSESAIELELTSVEKSVKVTNSLVYGPNEKL